MTRGLEFVPGLEHLAHAQLAVPLVAQFQAHAFDWTNAGLCDVASFCEPPKGLRSDDRLKALHWRDVAGANQSSVTVASHSLPDVAAVQL